MSETFLRVDLRDSAQGRAHDFRKVALQPGLPLLDPSNTNYRTLRKWFGVYVAQPEFGSDRPDSVGFCVCDEQQRRIVNARCEPLTENDLSSRSDVARQFEELKSKIQTIQPDNPKEATLLAAVRNHFNNLTAQPGNLGFSFFKYKNGSRWQLVWLWGFERRDSKPATAAVCKRDGCRHLIARRIGETSSCPVCQGPPMPFPKSREGSKRSCCCLMLLFLLALLLGGFWAFVKYFTPLLGKPEANYVVRTVPELEEPWKMPVGGRLKFQVLHINGEKEEDVTDQVDVMVGDPQTARIDRALRFVRAHGVGATTVSFHRNEKEIKAIPLTVVPPTLPETLRLDPAELALGIGTTRQLTVLGQYDDRRTIDLTEVATWKPNESPAVSNVLGLLEGLEEGKTEITASYSVVGSGGAVDASCKVEVVPENYTAMEIRGVPERLYEGFASAIEVTTQNEKGEQRILTRSPRLRFQVEPPEAAFVENGNRLTALTSGKAKLRALYDTISSDVLETSVEFEVVRDETASHFLVRPEEMKLVVGETAFLDILPRGQDVVSAVVKDDSVLELIDGNQAVGRKSGKTLIVVSQNNVQREIPVEVSEADWESVAFQPDRVSVAVDRAAPLRLVGTDRSGRQRDIVSDQIAWETEPDPEFVQFDPLSPGVIGMKPTGEQTQTVKARCGDRTAEARIEVLPAPLRLEMTPAGPVDLPVDQQIRFAVRADYGEGDVEIAPERIQWTVRTENLAETLPEGVVWDPSQGVLKAEKPGVGPIEISATYLGETTKSCQAKTCESSPVEVGITADKPSLCVGEQGNILITPKDAVSPCFPIPEKYSFTSAESNILNVDPETGEYLGTSPGKGTIAVSHPAVKGESSVPIIVEEANKPRLEIRPNNITLNVGQTATASLVKIEGDQEQKIPFAQSGDPLLTATNTAAARIRLPDRIVGVRPAPPFQIFAEYQGEKATATVEVKAKGAGRATKHCNDWNCKRCNDLPPKPPRNRYTPPPKRSGSPKSTPPGGKGSQNNKNGAGPGGGGRRPEAPKPKLVLDGPDRMTVDSEAAFTATLNGQDVTFDSTSLVLDRESAELAETLSGCLLRAKKPGTVDVRARHFNEVSNPLRVQIEPRAEKFDRLELEIDQSPMVIGERRPYKLWGHPAGGGVRQDLTLDVVAGSAGLERDGSPRVAVVDFPDSAKADQIVSHTPPYLSGKSTGRFGLAATYKDYRDDGVELEVVGRTGGKTLRVRPSSISLPAGEITPPITVSVESPLEPGKMIEVEAQLESDDAKILAPIPGVFNRFRAEATGKTSITVKAAGQEASIPVEVLDQPFHRISLDRSADMLADGRFRVYVNVEAKTKAEELEYRIAPLNEKDEQAWVPLETARQQVRLVSPELQGGAVDERHHLIIEVHDKQTDHRQRHPLDFRIKGKTIEVEP